MHVLVTGGTGYIGRRTVARLVDAGYSVTLLGAMSPIEGAQATIAWRLGEAVPPEAFASSIDAVLHIAHVWNSTGAEDDDVNLRGTASLLASARAAGVSRFVFASSVSSRADALNRYGRVKSRIERLLDGKGDTSARIGLVYGGPLSGQWGMLNSLARLPVLPMIASGRPVQPIHVDDVAEGLVQSLTHDTGAAFVLAGDPPVSFGAFLQAIASHRHGKNIFILPLPSAPFLLMLKVMNLFLPVAAIRERVLGLAGLGAQPAAADLKQLGLTLRAMEPALAAERPVETPEIESEAAALLTYILGRKPRLESIQRLAAGLATATGEMPVLPGVVQRIPVLLRLTEPLFFHRSPKAETLRRRLHAATVMAEAEPGSGFYAYENSSRWAGMLKLTLTAVGETLLLLPRALIGSVIWR